ncbi:MAG: hypothetical protein SGJ15_05435 [Bacteroidota bacterium]|nr:hypothetical protein [Bacteroidota bacterium]
MKKIILYFIIVSTPALTKAQTQNLYYKNLTDSIINTFSVDTNHLSIKRTDPMIKYKNYFNYVLCFYKNLEYKKIRIKSEKTHRVADVKPKPIDVIAVPEERVYTIIFSSKAGSLIDTVTFEKLSVDSKIALISKQISLIQEYSTLGFFEVIGMRFKKYSIKRSKELNKDVNLYSIEAGFGYQLMTYTNEVYDKLLEDNWTDKHAYKKYYQKNVNALMNYDAIKIYLYDYAVYLQNIYK